MSSAIWVDVALFVVFVVTVIVYTCRGFAKSVIGFVVAVASLFVASIFGPMLGDLMYNGFMLDTVGGVVTNALEAVHDGVAGTIDGEAIVASLPEAVKNLLSFAGVDIGSLGNQITAAGEGASGGFGHAVETIAKPIAAFLSELIAYILLFVVAMIIFKLLANLVVGIFELPVLRTLNKLAGFLMGLLVGFLFCWGIALAARLIFGMVALNEPAFLELADPSGTWLYSFFTSIGA